MIGTMGAVCLLFLLVLWFVCEEEGNCVCEYFSTLLHELVFT